MSISLSQFVARLLGVRRGKPHAGRPRRGHRKPGLERLEGRIVPAGQLVSYVMGGTAGTAVVGTVYEDLDSNGVRNNGENGISGWTVYLDLDQSGTRNTDAVGDLEPAAITNKDGDYVIDRVRPGTYRVAELL